MEIVDQSPVVQLQGLKKYFPIRKGIIFDRVEAWIKALDGVDLRIDRHQIIGLVGESGSGKSTLAKILLLMEKPTEGKVLFEGRDVFGFDDDQLKDYRHKVQAVFQDPLAL
jgi:ABC-type oligopeptide transport system ATPase subunit